MKKLSLNWLLFLSHMGFLLVFGLVLLAHHTVGNSVLIYLFLCLVTTGILLYVIQRYRRTVQSYTSVLNEIKKGHLDIDFGQSASNTFNTMHQALINAFVAIQDRFAGITQSRDEKQVILASMTEGIITVDLDFRVTNINRSAIKLLGYRKNAVLVGKKSKDVVTSEEINNLISDTLTNRASDDDLVLIKTNNRWYQIHSTLIKDNRGIATGALVVLNDVTRLKHLERVRTDFVANVSHELRTPITLIMTGMETLENRENISEKQVQRFISIVKSHTERLNAILEDLLTLSRLEQSPDEDDFRLEDGPVAPVIEKAIHLCESKAIQHNIQIKTDFQTTKKAKINDALLEQAFINLIDNAVKYSPSDKTVTITLKETEGALAIAVQDEGAGIPEKHLNRIFERFYRVDKARSRKIGGTGLGLSIVKHIAQVHNGSVCVNSTLNEGSTFTLLIPA